MNGRYKFKLFIVGRTIRSQNAVVNLRRICEEELAGEYELVIIDVLEEPEAAEENKILATPTLIKLRPEPTRRIIGDMSNRQKVLIALDITADV